ncbi:MAG: hypothetical protein N2246_00340, partial [Candidatus Sumerlaeia bacterium]|nr:hypothetical protein [Candidatus Sumerlaeia bacterium]
MSRQVKVTEIKSITETPNELTTDIDLADAVGICRLLRQTDSQIFNGWRHYPALRDSEIIERMQTAIKRIAGVLKARGKKCVVISGAGTSGRLAMFASRTFNYLLEDLGYQPVFEYLIAGGDKALIKAQEGAEDDPHQAVIDLQEKTAGAKQVVYIGVTCGFSAAYIAGQLDFASQQPEYFNILLGFNPIELARRTPIEKWDKTFYDVVQEIKDKPNCLILNPVLGPEPITGSTRMKGGSATKLMLEIIFLLALADAGILPRQKFLPAELRHNRNLTENICVLLDLFERTRIETYNEIASIAEMMKLAGNALRQKRHIYYLGESPAGVLGTIDASECPPTFGADFEDVRGFIKDGWNWMLAGGDDSELVNAGPSYRINLKEFEQHKLPHLSSGDLVIALALNYKTLQGLLTYLKRSRLQGAKTGVILIAGAKERISRMKLKLEKFCDVLIVPELTYTGLIRGYEFFGQVAMKWVLNAITTGAHIFSGKIYQNRMIDLRISNSKLFYRTIGIIST